MKKLSLLLLAAAFISQFSHAQNCTCNPNGWQPGTAMINNSSREIKCGYQFSLKCNDIITIREEYKCLGGCTAKYSAVLKNAAGAVVMSYPSFTFPWTYHFAAAGNYSLEITPLCSNSKCTPCRFFFTVTCTTVACDCNENGWQKFAATVGNNRTIPVSCNYQFSVRKNQPFRLEGKYICKGSCAAKYSALLKNNVTGAVIQSYPNFMFPWTYTFTIAGNYKLEITPICGEKRCQPCVFYFTAS